jgi:hypothetical protein
LPTSCPAAEGTGAKLGERLQPRSHSRSCRDRLTMEKTRTQIRFGPLAGRRLTHRAPALSTGRRARSSNVQLRPMLRFTLGLVWPRRLWHRSDLPTLNQPMIPCASTRSMSFKTRTGKGLGHHRRPRRGLGRSHQAERAHRRHGPARACHQRRQFRASGSDACSPLTSKNCLSICRCAACHCVKKPVARRAGHRRNSGRDRTFAYHVAAVAPV